MTNRWFEKFRRVAKATETAEPEHRQDPVLGEHPGGPVRATGVNYLIQTENSRRMWEKALMFPFRYGWRRDPEFPDIWHAPSSPENIAEGERVVARLMGEETP